MTAIHAPRRILVPVDFGEASARAVNVAASLARELGAELTVLHVESLDAPPYFTHDQVRALEAQRVAARAAARRYLAGFASAHGAPDATAVVAEGAVAAVILEHAETAHAIVMGTNERSLASRLWMGSVAERVSRESPVPVVVVNLHATNDVRVYREQIEQDISRRKEAVQ